jgi:hypothetical protein
VNEYATPPPIVRTAVDLPVSAVCTCCLQDATDDEVLQAYQQIRAERQRDEQQQHQQAHHTQQQQPQQPQANGAAGGAAAATPRQQQEDVSQLMADKMLAGWALLGDHCPM